MKGIKVLVLASVMFAVGRASKKKLKTEVVELRAETRNGNTFLSIINLNSSKNNFHQKMEDGNYLHRVFCIVKDKDFTISDI